MPAYTPRVCSHPDAFPDAKVAPRERWTFAGAALESSSHLEMGRWAGASAPTLADIRCFRLKLWDPEADHLVGYPEARAA